MGQSSFGHLSVSEGTGRTRHLCDHFCQTWKNSVELQNSSSVNTIFVVIMHKTHHILIHKKEKVPYFPDYKPLHFSPRFKPCVLYTDAAYQFLSWKQSIWLSRKEIKLLHESLVLMNQCWDVADSSIKNWLNAKRQCRLSEVLKADGLTLKMFENSMNTQRADGQGVSTMHIQLKWHGSENAKACDGVFLRLFNFDTEEEDFRGFSAQEKDE